MEDLWDYCIAKQAKDIAAGNRRKPLGQYVPKSIVLTGYGMSKSDYKIFMSDTEDLEPDLKTIRRKLTKRVYTWMQYVRVRHPKNFNRMSLKFIMNPSCRIKMPCPGIRRASLPSHGRRAR